MSFATCLGKSTLPTHQKQKLVALAEQYMTKQGMARHEAELAAAGHLQGMAQQGHLEVQHAILASRADYEKEVAENARDDKRNMQELAQRKAATRKEADATAEKATVMGVTLGEEKFVSAEREASLEPIKNKDLQDEGDGLWSFQAGPDSFVAKKTAIGYIVESGNGIYAKHKGANLGGTKSKLVQHANKIREGKVDATPKAGLNVSAAGPVVSKTEQQVAEVLKLLSPAEKIRVAEGKTLGDGDLIAGVRELLSIVHTAKFPEDLAHLSRDLRELVTKLQRGGKFASRNAPGSANKYSAGQVQATLNQILAGWKNPPQIEVRHSRDLVGDDKAYVAANPSKGFTRPDGTIVVLHDMAESIPDVKATIFHEALGHYGLRGKFGPALSKLLSDIYDSNSGFKALVDLRMTRYGESRQYAAEEVLAEGQTEPVTQGAWGRVVAMVRQFLRDMGISLNYSNNDIAAVLLEAQSHVKEQGTQDFIPPALLDYASRNTGDPSTPVGGIINKIAQAIKSTLFNSATRKNVLGWMSFEHMVQTYADHAGSWRDPFKRLWAEMQRQDGAMNAMRVASGVVNGKFQALAKHIGAKDMEEFGTFMRDTSNNRVDPRFSLMPRGAGFLEPLAKQAYYKKAKARVAAAEKALASLGVKDSAAHKADLAEAYEQLNAVEKGYKGMEEYFESLPTLEQEEKSAKEDGRKRTSGPNGLREDYLDMYHNYRKNWNSRWGFQVKDGSRLAHDTYDMAERHLKSLGAKELRTALSTWYDMHWSVDLKDADGNAVPKATSLKDMRKQMRGGLLGLAPREFESKVDNSMSRMYQGPYFHMARWGKFYLRFTNTMGETERTHFESEREYKAAYAEHKKLEAAGDISNLTHGVQGDETNKESLSYRQLQAMLNMAEQKIRSEKGADTEAGKKQADIKVALIRSTLSRAYMELLPETSTRSMHQLRKNIAGASADMARSFAKRSEAAHTHIALAEHMPKITQHLRDMEAEIKALSGSDEPGDVDHQIIARNVADEVLRRLKELSEQMDVPALDTLSSLNYTMYLAGNPAYFLTNLLQPFQFVSALGGTHGMVHTMRTLAAQGGKAFKILQDAGKGDFANPHMDFSTSLMAAEKNGSHMDLSLAQWQMLDELNRLGKLDVTLARELNVMSKSDTTNALANKATDTTRYLGAFGHYSEAYNRITSALAAYDLATSKKGGMSHEAAIKYATKAVDDSQLNYAGVNRARQLGKKGIAGAYTPLVMAFKTYQFQVMELHIRAFRGAFSRGKTERLASLMRDLKGKSPEEVETATKAFEKEEASRQKEGIKRLGGLLTMTSVLAGTMGLPMVSALAWALNGLGDDDEDIRNKWRNAVSDAFGESMGGMLTQGITHGVGVDTQGNIGLQDMVPFSRFLSDRREFKDKVQGLVNDSAGAGVGLVERVVAGFGQLADGHVMEALQNMMPKAISSVAKGAQLAMDGSYRDSKGNLLPMDADAWDVALTSAGYRPSAKADRDAQNRYYRSEKYLGNKEVASIHKEYNEARDSKDPAAAQEARQKLHQYNLDHPDARVSLQTLEQSYRTLKGQTQVAEMTGTGILAGRKEVTKLEDKYGWGIK